MGNGIVVPPGGFAGFAQMAPASKASLFPSGVRSTGTRRRRKAKARGKRKARASGSRTRGRKIKFGSPAWRKKYKLGKKKR